MRTFSLFFYSLSPTLKKKKKLIWRLFKGNLQFAVVTMYSLLYTGQQIFHPSSDSLTSLCEVSSEDIVKLSFCKKTVSEKWRGMFKVNWSLYSRAGARAQPCDVFSGPCNYSFVWLNPLRAPRLPTWKAKKHPANGIRDTHLNPGSLCSPIMHTSANFFTTRLSGFTVWLSFSFCAVRVGWTRI